MKETLSIFVTAIILVLLIVIFPLYNHFERQDDMSYNLVLKATTSFVDEIVDCGYISQEMYTNYIMQIANTGNLYDIELEAHKKVLVKSDNSNQYEEQYLIDYNDDIFSTQITNTSNINNKVIKDGVYKLNVGDKIYIKLKNSSTTMAGALFNIIVPTSTSETIKVNYGGIVKNNTWKQAYAPLFEKTQISLNFNLNTNGDNNAVYNSNDLSNGLKQDIYSGTKYTTFIIPNAIPTRTNCTFKGWSKNKDGKTVEYHAGDKIKLDESTILYAIWTYNPIPLTLNANGGGPVLQTKTLTYESKYIALTTATKPTKSGYIFDGWYTAATGGTKITSDTNVTSTNNVTLYAQWKAMQMTITLNANGGSVTPNSYTGTYKQKYGTLPTPSRTGYTFNGWYLDTSYSTKVTENTIINTAANHTLYAKWTANSYTITYNANGGSGVAAQSKTYGSTLGTLPITSMTGHKFEGWYTSGGTKITSSTIVTGNATYYAQWTAIPYTITYMAKGGSSVAAQTKTYGSTLGTLPTTSRTGHRFEGWYTSGGTKITSSTIVTGDATYFAKWTAMLYKITYNANGGSAVALQYKTYGSTLGTLPTTSRTGWTFNGWYTAATGGTKITSSTIVTGDAIYYAKWNLETFTAGLTGVKPGNPLYVRDAPSKENGKIIDYLWNGNKVTVLDSVTNSPWWKVKLENGTIGYSHSDYLKRL